uniref:Ribosomal protein L34 n=1 Tax=Bostrychia simpliciuscula TaxID=324754 RepID=A0A1Z1M7J6_9FLOR|nr:ribosomal protein L34 [Bostrychia simpliciuscula]ARW61986.1 ribosomal protein L34 [Bostrychia simpliciuscula]
MKTVTKLKKTRKSGFLSKMQKKSGKKILKSKRSKKRRQISLS